MKKLKNWVLNLVMNFWSLNWEAKIGILFLIPPVIGVIRFIFNFDSYETFIIRWVNDDEAIAISLYLGLMAIAGAHLIKGNLNKK